MRTIVILVVLIILLALVRLLIADVARAVSGALRSEDAAQRRKQAFGAKSRGRLVQDPHTGSYVDEQIAVKSEIGGRVYYFESEQSRDAFLREQRKAG